MSIRPSVPPLVAIVLAVGIFVGSPLVAGGAQEESPPATAASSAPTRLESPAALLVVEPPGIGVAGVVTRVAVRVEGASADDTRRVEVREGGPDGAIVGEGVVDGAGPADVSFTPRVYGAASFVVRTEPARDRAATFELRVVPGWITLLPALLAIVLALVFRQVVPSLLVGVWAGAWIYFGGPFVGTLRTLDHYVIRALADTDHVSIIVVSLLLGGMVGVVSRSGGTVGLVESLRPWATSSRRGQLVTWLLGILVFFDDYANTLLVGNTMRPVTDRLRVSREKLAYIVDSTAAPVASVALISTWIGYEVSLIAVSLKEIGSNQEAYGVFLQSLPYRFYPFLALVFGVLVAVMGRDFGPMRRAEQRARAGRLLSERAQPLSDFDSEVLQPPEGKPLRWINAALPVLIVLGVTFAGLWWTGRESLATAGDPSAGLSMFDLGAREIGRVFGAGDSFKALLWGSFAGCVAALALAVTQRILRVGEALEAWVNGVKSMVPAFIILTLAWAIAAVCSDLSTSGFMVAALSDHLAPGLLPAIVFTLAALTSFATGTSWGTMGILIPLSVPTAYGVARAAGLDGDAAQTILLGSVSAVLAGAIFGDHCSPISDTTVMSSMSSGCDHVDHVRTQLPYAIVVAVVAIVFGYVPGGFGVSPWIGMAAGGLALAGLLRFAGRTAEG